MTNNLVAMTKFEASIKNKATELEKRDHTGKVHDFNSFLDGIPIAQVRTKGRVDTAVLQQIKGVNGMQEVSTSELANILCLCVEGSFGSFFERMSVFAVIETPVRQLAYYLLVRTIDPVHHL